MILKSIPAFFVLLLTLNPVFSQDIQNNGVGGPVTIQVPDKEDTDSSVSSHESSTSLSPGESDLLNQHPADSNDAPALENPLTIDEFANGLIGGLPSVTTKDQMDGDFQKLRGQLEVQFQQYILTVSSDPNKTKEQIDAEIDDQRNKLNEILTEAKRSGDCFMYFFKTEDDGSIVKEKAMEILKEKAKASDVNGDGILDIYDQARFSVMMYRECQRAGIGVPDEFRKEVEGGK